MWNFHWYTVTEAATQESWASVQARSVLAPGRARYAGALTFDTYHCKIIIQTPEISGKTDKIRKESTLHGCLAM